MADPALLVLEDDPEMRSTLIESLEDNGYRAQGASNASEALTLAQRFEFELVISDVRMAGGMDGLGALEVLKSRVPQLKCIVITGYTSQEAPARAVRICVDDYLFKPFRLPELLACVARVLRSGQAQAGYRSLLSSLLAGPRGLFEKAEAGRRELALTTLEEARLACVQAIFVGIRSNMLSRGAALDAWDRLEELEHRQDQLDDAPLLEYQQLTQEYRQLFELLSAMARSQAVGTHQNRSPGQVDKVRFQRLFERIAQGRVTPEQLGIAGLLRHTDLFHLRANPQLFELYQSLWE